MNLGKIVRRAMIVALIAMLGSALSAAAAPAQHSESMVWRVGDESVVEGASASLVRTDNGLTMQINTSELEPGAYTVWWVIFNNPEFCSDMCGEDDLPFNGGDPNVNVVLPNATGHAVGQNGVGNFGAYIQVGTSEGLMDPRGAEVHLIVRTHGPVQQGNQQAQYSTFNGGCNDTGMPPEIPGDDCENVQFAIFLP